MLHIESLSKCFRDKKVLDEVSLDVGQGEMVVLVGESGVGKTTLLNIIAGLVTPDDGLVAIDGKVVEKVAGQSKRVSIPPELRSIGYVPQNYVLFPFLTVRENVAFGLKGRLVNREVARTVDSILSTLELAKVANQRPSQLSGGQKQRVALARALATRPRLLLMDEPLSALDEGLRGRVREELAGFLSAFKTTVLYVTHDLDDAFALGDRVAVLVRGRVSGVAPMGELLNNPPNLETAKSLGLNCFRGRMIASNEVEVEDGVRLLLDNAESEKMTEVMVSFRQDSVKVPGERSDDPVNVLLGRVMSAYEGKDIVRMTVDAGIKIECSLIRRQYELAKIEPGKEIRLVISPSDIHVGELGLGPT